MPKYLIERHIPGASQMSERDLSAMALKSRRVLAKLGPDIQWLHSYMTDDAAFCVFIAPNEDLIHEHARIGEFPVTSISRIGCVIDPSISENAPPKES